MGLSAVVGIYGFLRCRVQGLGPSGFQRDWELGRGVKTFGIEG